jgi:hypothetical protein
MKQDGFSYVVRAELVFSQEEAALLKHMSETHYDLKCKKASMQGGLVFAIQNRTSTDHLVDEPVPSAYTFSELDHLAKIMCGTYDRCDDIKIPGRALRERIKTVMNRLSAEDRRIQAMELEPQFSFTKGEVDAE